MNKESNYENYHFTRDVNTISTVPKSFHLHWHKYIEICVMTKDLPEKHCPKIRLNQILYTLKPGDVLFFWPGEVHEIVDNSKDSLAFIQFMPNLINELKDFSPYINLLRSVHHIAHEDFPSLADSIQYHIKEMYTRQASNNMFKGTETLICLYEMFIEIGIHTQNQLQEIGGTSQRPKKKTLDKMQQACNYITDNCEKELTLENVAELMNFSTCYFSRIFKQLTGFHFVEYLTMQRVRRAQSLLSDTDLSVTEISFQSGFKSISTFNRVFRQYRGCSPSEYRKYYQNY